MTIGMALFLGLWLLPALASYVFFIYTEGHITLGYVAMLILFLVSGPLAFVLFLNELIDWDKPILDWRKK